jgi:urease accessory protein UreE
MEAARHHIGNKHSAVEFTKVDLRGHITGGGDDWIAVGW